MATTLTLLNNTLRGLRQFGLLLESGATSTTDEYVLMILQFLNEAKEEVEECGWAWQALRSTVTLTLSSGTAEYDIVSSGSADTDTNDRTRLLYENVSSGTEQFRINDSSLPQVFDTTDSAESRLKEITQERMERWHLTDSDETGEPVYFAVWNDGNSLRIKFHPTPDATYTIKLRLFIPQAELTSTDLTTTLSVPSRPVWAKALWKANQERGEELGKQGSDLHITYLDALGYAVAKEQSPADTTVFLER